MTTEINASNTTNLINRPNKVSLNLQDDGVKIDNSEEVISILQIVGHPKSRRKSVTQSLKMRQNEAPCSLNGVKCNIKQPFIQPKEAKKDKKEILCGIFSCF
jgi:hypothetical protein